MNPISVQNASDILVQMIEQDERYRVLRQIPRAHTNMPSDGSPPPGRCIAIVDVETTGLDVENDHLIELAIMLVFVDDDGVVAGHMGPVSWLEDPGGVIDPKITLLTGLAVKHVAGKSINDAMAASLLDRADVIVAQNARFDAAWIEKRYPALAGKAWACSCTEIDWLLLDYEGRSQQHLLAQHGWFTNAHRAAEDVWSLFHLLQQEQIGPGENRPQTHLQRLLYASSQITERVEAARAPYSAKDRLKARGYRWDAVRKVWWKEMGQSDLAAERSWYRQNGLPEFFTKPITAHERHR